MEFKNGLDVLVYILKDELEQHQLELDRLEKAKNEQQQQCRSQSRSRSLSPANEARSNPESSRNVGDDPVKRGLGFVNSHTHRAKRPPERYPSLNPAKKARSEPENSRNVNDDDDPDYSVNNELGFVNSQTYRAKQVRVVRKAKREVRAHEPDMPEHYTTRNPDYYSVKEELGLVNSQTYRAKQVRVVKKAKTEARAQEPDMPEAMRDHITRNKLGHDIKLVIQKALCKSDVVRNNHRFSIPVNKVESQFLTPEEEEFFKERDEKGKKKGREVTLVEPTARDETVVHFKRWEMEKSNGGKTSSSYVFTHTWMDVVERNGFSEGDLVQLWSFRVGPELNFAMVLVERAG